MTDCLRTHVTPVLKATVPDGSLSTGRPVWQDFAHFLPGVGGASGDFDANGPYTRVLVNAGSQTLTGGLLGGLVGTAPPGGLSLLGAHPVWVGDLTSSDFRPEVACSTEALPDLSARAAPATATVTRQAIIPPASPKAIRARLLATGRPRTGSRRR